MEKRKNPQIDIKKYSGLFFQIGLLSALLITVSAFEWESPMKDPEIDITKTEPGEIPFILPTEHEEKKKPPKPKKIAINVVETKEEPDIDIKVFDMGDPIVDIPEVLPEPEVEIADVVEVYVKHMPEPKEGMTAFLQYISKNVKYTRKARDLGIEGKVFVQFVVDKEGNLTEIEIVRGVGAGLDEEALRAMQNAPAWNPGRQGGRRVKVRMIIPISFQLQ
jgi:protein TonB